MVTDIEPSIALDIPFTTRPHLYAEPAHRLALDWIRTTGVLTTPQTLARLDRKRYGHFVGMIYPDGQFAHLVWMVQFTDWLFEIDDCMDETAAGTDPDSLTIWHRDLIAALTGDAPASIDTDAYVYAAHDLSRTFMHLKTATWRGAFLAAFTAYLEATVWEANNRRNRQIPNLEDYLTHRRKTSSMEVYLWLIDLAMDIDSRILRTNPRVLHMLNLTNDAVSWANDISSLPKEAVHGDQHNLVIVLEESGLSRQAALDRAARMHNATVQLFITLSTTTLPHHPTMQQLRLGCAYWMAANRDWTEQTTRYGRVSDWSMN